MSKQRIMNFSRKNIFIGIFAATLLFSKSAFAASSSSNPYTGMRLVLLGVGFLCLFLILALAKSIIVLLPIKMKKFWSNKASAIVSAMLVLPFLFSSKKGFAQETEETVTVLPNATQDFFHQFPTDVWVLILINIILIFGVFILFGIQSKLLKEIQGISRTVATEVAGVKKEKVKLWDRLTGKNTQEEIEKLDLQHDYDGIRELDNKIPGWWQIAFAGTVSIGIIYLIRMFVTGGLPDQITELERDQAIAAKKIETYLKNSANNVDENTVAMLDAAGISNGATLFQKNCVACHGANAEGAIGPNLTDEYWLHSGSIKDVFYSIKYGWPEKGMKSWMQDFSPIQIAEISSYIMSIKGSNPPNAKEPQGEPYKE